METEDERGTAGMPSASLQTITALAHRLAPWRRSDMRIALTMCCVFVGTSCATAEPIHSVEIPVNSSPANRDAASTVAAGFARTSMHDASGAVIDVEFAYQAGKRLVQVRYGLRNKSPQSALAVFDRGGAHDVRSGRQVLGAIAAPTIQVNGDDVELMHTAQPLPDPAPYAPSTPIAIKLEPGAELAGRFEFSLPGNAAPKRLRWCIGVTAFDPSLFDSPRATPDGEVWAATFAAVGKQQVLCTPWFDVASGSFES
jgi:hypothetical protein